MPSETEYLYMAVGVLGFVYVSSLFPSLKKLSVGSEIKSGGCSKCKAARLENIPGIDVNALRICRENGLI